LSGRQRDEQRVFKTGKKDATMYSTLDGAKNCAKQLRQILEASSLIFPLSKCQTAVAQAGGYQDWHELVVKVHERPQFSRPFNYWDQLLEAVPHPCRRPITFFLRSGRKIGLSRDELWVHHILPYCTSMEVVLRSQVPFLRPGAGRGQRMRLEVVSGLLLNSDGLVSYPKLDPQLMHLVFEGNPGQNLPSRAKNKRFSEVVETLVEAGILMIERETTRIMLPNFDLASEVQSRAEKWGRHDYPAAVYETMDSDLAAALAVQDGIEYRDSGPKVPYDEMTFNGVVLQSRYSVAHEFETMKSVVDAMDDYVRLAVRSIWCDSKASAVYSVTIWEGASGNGLYDDIRSAFRTGAEGFNGIWVFHGDKEVVFDPEWPGDDEMIDELIRKA
jgi:hypothetical protein